MVFTLQADLGVSDDQGWTALHYAVSRQSLPCVQAIVETNVNLMVVAVANNCGDKINPYRKTTLIWLIPTDKVHST